MSALPVHDTLLKVSCENTVKKVPYFPFIILAVVSILVVALLLLLSPKPVSSVTVANYGTTYDAAGNINYCFQITNRMAEVTYVSYALEVLHNGIWFNAFPQPNG